MKSARQIWPAAALSALLLAGCAAVTVVDTAVSVTTTAVGTAVDATAAVVEGTADLVTGDDED